MISLLINFIGYLYLTAYCSVYIIKFKYQNKPKKFNNFLLQWIFLMLINVFQNQIYLLLSIFPFGFIAFYCLKIYILIPDNKAIQQLNNQVLIYFNLDNIIQYIDKYYYQSVLYFFYFLIIICKNVLTLYEHEKKERIQILIDQINENIFVTQDKLNQQDENLVKSIRIEKEKKKANLSKSIIIKKQKKVENVVKSTVFSKEKGQYSSLN